MVEHIYNMTELSYFNIQCICTVYHNGHVNVKVRKVKVTFIYDIAEIYSKLIGITVKVSLGFFQLY